MDPRYFDLPPPKNWQDFEELCHTLWELEWDCPNIQRHGRSGQNQRGVDIFGLPRGGSGYCGIQCKLKSSSVGSNALTSAELEHEVSQAKKFRPQLEHLTVATTAAADTKIQAAAREISDRNAAAGLFRVDVLAWPEILARLFKHDELLNRYYPRLGSKLPRLGDDDVRAIRNFLPADCLDEQQPSCRCSLGFCWSQL